MGMEHPLRDPQGRNQVQAGIPSFLDGGISQAQFNPSFIQTLTRVCALKEVKEDRDRHNWLLCVCFFLVFLKIKNLSALPCLGNLRHIKIYGVKGLG